MPVEFEQCQRAVSVKFPVVGLDDEVCGEAGNFVTFITSTIPCQYSAFNRSCMHHQNLRDVAQLSVHDSMINDVC